jgi:hypothetical protein
MKRGRPTRVEPLLLGNVVAPAAKPFSDDDPFNPVFPPCRSPIKTQLMVL